MNPATFKIPFRPAALALYAAAVLALCAAMLVIGFRITAQTNLSPDEFDQGAYRQMAGQMRGSWYPWYSDGTRNPLFPWIAARFLDPADPAFLAQGKNLNVLLATLGTAVLGIFFASRFSLLVAFNATAIGGLAALLPIGTFLGAEAVFQVLFLLACAFAFRLLNDNRLILYAGLGLSMGLAYLAKASTTPLIALVLTFSLLRLALELALPGRLPWILRAPNWSPRRLAVGLIIFGGIFLALVTPRLIHSQKTWGSPLYSLPEFWFWADDWQTCTQKYYDCRKVTLAKLPPEEQPTLAGYFRRHTAEDAFVRLTHGASVRLGQLFHPENKWRIPIEKPGKPRRVILPHRGFFLIGLGLLAVAMGIAAAVTGRLSRIGPVGLPVLMGLALFLIYLAAMGWYLPTGPGHRFIMTIYLPLLWMITQGGEDLRRAADAKIPSAIHAITHGIICLLVVVRLALLLVDTTFDKVSYAF